MTLLAPADPDGQLGELREYLGGAYDLSRLQRHQHEVEAELERLGSEDELYRSSEAYLYDLTVFAMSGTKEPYLRELVSAVPAGARLLDYGCGIGSDGLRLLEAGYDVSFADFDNPSVRYLRWRLARRGLEAPIYDLDRDELPGGFDLAYSFDVIEHVDEPAEFLERLEGLASLVLVNLLAPEPGETSFHRRLPIRALLAHARRRRVVHYGVYHGRSHLVLYGSRPAGWPVRLRSRLTMLGGKRRG